LPAVRDATVFEMSLPPEAPALPPRLLDCARVLPDRDAILPLLPRGRAFAEVGVATGDFSQKVMDVCAPSLFIGIDAFRLHELTEFWGRPIAAVFGGRTHGDAYRARFAAAIAAGRMRVLEGNSWDCLDRLPPGSVDIVYIDAEHDYDSARRDLAAAGRAVAADGWIVVNDYIMVAGLNDPASYGVVHATNEFMLARDWGMQYFALQTRMFCDVALRPAHLLQPPEPGIGALAAENQRLCAEIAALRHSTSWRAMAPLRATTRLARRLLR
jgi:hypothetical protein